MTCIPAPSWRSITQLSQGKTHVVPALWAHCPRLNAHARVTLLDVDGPGTVSCIHASMLLALQSNCQTEGTAKDQAAQKVILRVYYDGQSEPAIEMPFMDFLADVGCTSDYFSTVHMSKVRWSHNFRLPMPFAQHLTIELENPTDVALMGYVDVQWEQVDSLPPGCGYLQVAYRDGVLNSATPETLFDHRGAGKIVAHWLQYESAKSTPSPGTDQLLGEWICEADQQIFLDGDQAPTLNYLGSEDVYGFSWGYHQRDGDGQAAILKVEPLPDGGQRVAALRCRSSDAICYRKSCRWVLTFENDPEAMAVLGKSPIPFRHAVYYYALNDHKRATHVE